MWNLELDIQVTLSTQHLINCLVLREHHSNTWQLSLIYGPPTPTLRPSFLDRLAKVGNSFQGEWVVMDNFNMLLSRMYKMGGRIV